MQQLGKYRIIEELGRGGFATVYRAEDTTLGREIALKVLDPLLMRDTTWVAQFRREARTIAALNHQHIVTVYEVNESDERLYLAMSLAEGGTLAQHIAKHGHLSWKEMLSLLQPVCAALDYAHSKGVVHRDLKPANILLTQEGQPLLTDFGFARLMVDNSMSLSMSGGILGTPAYIAPEVWELDTATPAADMYALGCIVAEMLTGTVLFSGKSPMQVMVAHSKGPQYPKVWPDGTPPGIESVLDRALARDPAERYPNAMVFWHTLADLERLAEDARLESERAAVVAQWQAEAEAALARGELDAARMAVGRWLQIAPQDEAALALRNRLLAQKQENQHTAIHGETVHTDTAENLPSPDTPFWKKITQKPLSTMVAIAVAVIIVVLAGIGMGRMSLFATPEPTPTGIITPVPPTATDTPTIVPTQSPTATATATPTSTQTITPRATVTPTHTLTITPKATPTPTSAPSQPTTNTPEPISPMLFNPTGTWDIVEPAKHSCALTERKWILEADGRLQVGVVGGYRYAGSWKVNGSNITIDYYDTIYEGEIITNDSMYGTFANKYGDSCSWTASKR